MNIHQMLHSVTRAGTILTYSEIRDKVLALYPDAKAQSILPSEHVKSRKCMCKACCQQPLFKKLSHGLYRVLDTPKIQRELSIHEKLNHSLEPFKHQVLSIKIIREHLTQAFPETHPPSIIPSDHTYGGACKVCAQTPLLERTTHRGYYRILSPLQAFMQERTILPVDNGLQSILKKCDLKQLAQQKELLAQELKEKSTLQSREIHLILAALNEQVVRDLLDFSPLSDPNLLKTRLAQRLYDQQGICLPLAHWAVEVWSEAIKSQHYIHNSASSITATDETVPSLQLYNLSHTKLHAKISLFKKRGRRVALLFQDKEKTQLGLRKELLSPDLEQELEQWGTKIHKIPAQIYQQKTKAYHWYQLKEASDTKQALAALDRIFD